MDAAAIQEKYFVSPAQYSDLAALVGETADNLPGVPGVGPKTAAKWINLYGGLEGVLADLDAIGGKVGDALRDHVDAVKRNRKLNRLHTDLDLPLTLDELADPRPDQRRWRNCSTNSNSRPSAAASLSSMPGRSPKQNARPWKAGTSQRWRMRTRCGPFSPPGPDSGPASPWTCWPAGSVRTPTPWPS